MTTEELNSVQAWAAIAQAVSAVLALVAAVAVPYIQRSIEAKNRLDLVPGMLWFVPKLGMRGPGTIFTSNLEDFDQQVMKHGDWVPAVEITNHSSFPITVIDIGVKHSKKSSTRSMFIGAVIGDPLDTIPCTIQPRSCVRIAFTKAIFRTSYSDKTLAYAVTANGAEIYSSAKAWNFLAHKVNQRRDLAL